MLDIEAARELGAKRLSLAVVRLQGERWRVSSEAPLQAGQTVRVLARDGVLLQVTAAEDGQREEVE